VSVQDLKIGHTDVNTACAKQAENMDPQGRGKPPADRVTLKMLDMAGRERISEP